VGGKSRSDLFVGRTADVELLRRLVADVAAGQGGAVLVEGEPGIGKSALLATGLADARRLGCEVLWGAADELGQRFPLQVMLECLRIDPRSPDSRRAEIARLLRGDVARAGTVPVAASGAGDPVVAAVERLLALVDVLCSASPVVLVVDDLQWADEASLLVWHRLSRAVAQLPLLLVGACRPVPQREELERLRRGLRSRDGVVVSLGPLSSSEVSELVSGLVGAPAGPELRRRAKRAEGNPLYVREVVDALLREEAVRVEAGVADVVRRPAGGRPPTSLSAAIADRLDFLSAASREVLRAAALLGAEFSVTDLGLVVRRPASQLVGVVEEAVAAGVVAPSGPLLRFRHALIRQALYEAMPAAVRSALHRQAAQALADAGAAPSRIAQQLLAVVDAPDMWTLDWLRESASALIYRAPVIATELLERAIGHSPADDPRREHLEACLATVAFVLARHEQIERHARHVLIRTSDPNRSAEMTWILAYTLMRTGRAEQGIDTVRTAQASPTIPPAWAARLAALHALLLLGNGQIDEAAAVAEQALDEAERVGDRVASAYALHALSIHSVYRGGHAGVLDFIDRALTLLGDDPESADLQLILLGNRALELGQLDRLDEADKAISSARTLAERTGTSRLGMIQVNAAELHFRIGRWDDAAAELESVVDLPETEWLPLVLHGLAAVIAGHRDDWATARAHIAAAQDLGIPRGRAGGNANYLWSNYLLMARALAAERDGKPEEALAVLAPTIDADYVLEHRHLWLPDVVRLALALGDAPTAQAATAAAAAEAGQEGLPCKVATAQRCRGLLESDPAPLLMAAKQFRSVGWPLLLGQTLEDAAVLLAGQGDLDAARGAVTEAVEVYAGLGADWDVARIDARVRRLGIRRGPRGPRRRATSGWAALSPTEEKVARLVAQGRSNPEIGVELFLSRRTVQTHVSHIMTKLGVRSRSEIARETALHPRGGSEPSEGSEVPSPAQSAERFPP